MAVSPLNLKHVRSTSLPSTSHPLILRVEEQVNRLRASETIPLSSICQYLGGLNDLYGCVHDMLQLAPLNQQAMSSESVEQMLDGSLRLVDICGAARDFLSQMKENVHELQSAFRRRRGGALDINNDVGTYISSRKQMSKEISKCLVNLKKTENKFGSTLLETDLDLVAMVKVLREVEVITISTFESLLASISGSKAQSKPSGWSLVSKLRHTKRVSCEREEADTSEAEKADLALKAVVVQKSCQGVENAQKRLDSLELKINGLKNGLECIFKHLIKIRVSLLNALNH